MSLKDEVRECPATYGLAAAWVAVYAAMLWAQGGSAGGASGFLGLGAIDPRTTELFGDLTWRDFARGQAWRVLTASFLHFGLAHLAMNLIGMIQLGRLMEPWYGGRQFLAICLGLGAMGNLFGVLMRQGVDVGRGWLQAHGLARALPGVLAGGAPGVARNIHAGGGSTVILGLIGLGLVVGWRSRTRVGAFLRDQMVAFLVFTALIGIVGMKIVDNYGHAGGAIAGAALGFLHRRIVRTPERGRVRRLAGWASLAVVLGCVGGQTYVARGRLAEARREAEVREASARAAGVGRLIALLGEFRLLSEVVAFDRLTLAIDDASRRGDPGLAAGLDWSPCFELRPHLSPTSPRPVDDRIKALVDLRLVLDAIDKSRADLAPGTTAEGFDELLALGRSLATGPIDSRELYALRVVEDDLVRRAVRSAKEWLARRDAPEAARPAD